MPTAPNTANYQVGGAIVSLGGLDLGNIVSMEVDPTDLEILEHFTARSGARTVDQRIVVQKRLTFTVELDEHQADLYRKFFMGGGGALTVFPLTSPILETNCVITYRNETAVVWTYSHTRVQARPSGAMDMGEFDDWVTYELEIEALRDSATPSNPHGVITFTA